jgi:hypothetical protein
MVVLKQMIKPAKSNHGVGIDKCTSQMRPSGVAGKNAAAKQEKDMWPSVTALA